MIIAIFWSNFRALNYKDEVCRWKKIRRRSILSLSTFCVVSCHLSVVKTKLVEEIEEITNEWNWEHKQGGTMSNICDGGNNVSVGNTTLLSSA